MLSLSIRPQAQTDIDEIIDYLLENRTTSAPEFVTALQQTFDLIAENPAIGVKREYRPDVLQGIRMFPVKRPFSIYLLFYQPTETTLDIIRVLHGNRDIAQLFKEM